MDDVNDLVLRRVQPENQKDKSEENLIHRPITKGQDVMDASKDQPTLLDNGEAAIDRNGKQNVEPAQFGVKGYFSLLMPFLSLVAFVVDIVTDIILAIEYKRKGEMTFFWLTLVFITIPGVVLIIIDWTFLYVDYSARKHTRRNDPKGEDEEMTDLTTQRKHEKAADPKDAESCITIKMFARVILSLPSLGIAIRIIQHMYYKYKELTDTVYKDYYKERVRITKRDYALLSFICAFTETYSQAALQLYIFTMNPVSLNSKIGFSIISSVFFMPLAFASHYRSMRLQSSEDIAKKDMHLLVYVFYYFGVLGAMMFRIVSIGLFLAAIPITIGAPIVNVHCVFVFLWLWLYHQPTFHGLIVSKSKNRVLHYIGKIFYLVIYSVTSMLFFVDLYDENKKARVCFSCMKTQGTADGEMEVRSTKWRMLGYNIVLYAESAVFIGFGFAWGNVDVQMYVIVLLVGLLMHVVFIPSYYKCLHPTIGICCNCNDSNGGGDSSQEAQQPLEEGREEEA